MKRRGAVLVFGPLFSIHLYRWCQFLKTAGFDVGVVAVGEGSRDFDYSSVATVHALPTIEPRGRGRLIRAVESRVRRCQREAALRVTVRSYRVINFHWFAGYGDWGRFVRPGRRRSVLTCWGSDVNDVYCSLEGAEKERADRVLRRSACITYNAASVRDNLLSRCAGLSPSRLRQVDWGVDTVLFRPFSAEEKAEIRRELGFGPADRIILSPRLANPSYQVEKIVEWFLARRFPAGWHLLVRVPPFNREDGYVQRLKHMAQGNQRVRFDERNLDYKELPRLYALADFCVHHPRNDAISVSVLEGLACGCQHILSSAVQSHRELAGTYDVVLSDLDSLSPTDLERRLADASHSAAANRRLVERHHSERVSIQRIGEIFGARWSNQAPGGWDRC